MWLSLVCLSPACRCRWAAPLYKNSRRIENPFNPIPSKKHDCFSRFPPGIVASAGIEPASILLKEMDDRLYRSFLPAPHFHKSNIRSSCLRSGSLSLSWKGAHIQHSASFSRVRRFISANPVIECASTTQFLDLLSWVVVAGGVEPPFLAGVAALTRHSPCPPYTPAVSTRCRWRNSDWTCGIFFL